MMMTTTTTIMQSLNFVCVCVAMVVRFCSSGARAGENATFVPWRRLRAKSGLLCLCFLKKPPPPPSSERRFFFQGTKNGFCPELVGSPGARGKNTDRSNALSHSLSLSLSFLGPSTLWACRSGTVFTAYWSRTHTPLRTPPPRDVSARTLARLRSGVEPQFCA